MKLDAAFRKSAEQIAEELRAELGITNFQRLDPHALFESLEVPVISMTELVKLTPDELLADAINYLQTEETSLSAATVFDGPRRMVVFNDTAPGRRQASDLTHEAAHSLLLHTPQPVRDALGCRLWDDLVETEAQYLGGCLLIPGKGARYAAKAGWTEERTAREFGCSPQMVTWRLNITGARRVKRSR